MLTYKHYSLALLILGGLTIISIFKFLFFSWGFISFFKSFIFFLILFFSFYWIYSIFVFLYKRTQYSLYVSSLQRFWKRALYLFWIIELFLFFIYMFIMVSAPNETYYLLDHKVLFTGHDLVSLTWFKSTRYVIIVLWVLNFMILFGGYFIFNILCLGFLHLIFLKIIYEEFSQTYYVLSVLQNDTYNFNPEVKRSAEGMVFYQIDEKTGKPKLNTALLSEEFRLIEEQKRKEVPYYYEMYNFLWEEGADDLRYRSYFFFVVLTTVLKFWHIGFIYAMFFISTKFFLFTPVFSVNLLSSNLQNVLFLFMFLFLTFLVVYKYYMNFIAYSSYFYFFLNYNTWFMFFTSDIINVFFYEYI